MMVSIYIQVYNTKPYLEKCVESVLNQTFSDFECILIDNGSTDGCKELLERYAARDGRIRLIRFEENRPAPIWLKIAQEAELGKYIATLDSDDFLELDFLERMLKLAEREQLDVVCTGTAFHMEGQSGNISGTRSLPQRIVMGQPEYAAYFPYYHAFFRTVWGKLIRREVFMAADLSIIDREEITNGSDTLSAFAWLRQSKRVCIDNSVLHHYLVRQKSISRIYLPNRFKSNTVLHQDAVDFLSQYGPVSRQNRHFLHIVYANAVLDTLGVLWTSDLSAERKLEEYCAIAAHPTTIEAYQDTDEAIDRSRNTLIQQLSKVALAAKGENPALPEAMARLRPRCGRAFTSKAVPLFRREPPLLDALIRDDWDGLVECLMSFIAAKQYTKQFDLGGLLGRLIPEGNPLNGITDTRFFQKHTESCMLTLCGNYPAALEQMTGVLFENRKIYGKEEFLRLYLRLADMERQDSACIFGRICLAELYLCQNRREECGAILEELTAMGAEENAQITALREQLGR